MRSTHPLLILLFSLLSSTVAAIGSRYRVTGLRSDTDAYEVEAIAGFFWVFSPYFKSKREAVTKLQFPPDAPDTIRVLAAYNDEQRATTDSGRKLLMSDIIPAVASSRHANRPLASVDWLVDDLIIDEPLVDILDNWFKNDWMKKNPGATIPSKFTLTPSDPVWRKLQATTFFMGVSNTFRGAGKIVESIVIRPRKGFAESKSKSLAASDLWYHLQRPEGHK
ncbi:hypothetical protein LX32DRAFT_638660 [Colletotrichum zoysiae]|uniref:Uncharacterized protein n=1 Tax=Colletotrichum zoysiae TaxID=1216348 RepID=A0AAD9HL65_9PEZI|nr:hypothetical protein LX32DRAFT_638660 [Colletotrichum zoysiae]